jgi:hypothetical protein
MIRVMIKNLKYKLKLMNGINLILKKVCTMNFRRHSKILIFQMMATFNNKSLLYISKVKLKILMLTMS